MWVYSENGADVDMIILEPKPARLGREGGLVKHFVQARFFGPETTDAERREKNVYPVRRFDVPQGFKLVDRDVVLEQIGVFKETGYLLEVSARSLTEEQRRAQILGTVRRKATEGILLDGRAFKPDQFDRLHLVDIRARFISMSVLPLQKHDIWAGGEIFEQITSRDVDALLTAEATYYAKLKTVAAQAIASGVAPDAVAWPPQLNVVRQVAKAKEE